MKYILISIDDANWDRTTLPKIAAALTKFKVAHVQAVTFGNGDIREYVGKHRKQEDTNGV